jgi:hypothetical protein
MGTIEFSPSTNNHQMNYRLIVLYLLVSTVLFLSGCGGEQLPPGIPKLYPATITVVQDGHPLAGAEVIILNADPSTNWSAGGVTDSNGVLKLKTMGRYAGAPLGTYKVSVSKIEVPDITLPSDVPDDPAERKEYNRIVKEIENNTFYIVDPKFKLGRSQLKVEITPSNLHHEVDVSPAIRVKVPPAQQG